MNYVDIKTDCMPLPDKEQFLVSCGRVVERISASAPSDSLINVAVDYDGDDFLLSLDVISGELNFSVVHEAKSPFVALEKIHKDSMERIKKWTATRKIQVA
ncbi:MAG: hypothetical protein J7501_04495 [Bdellovibrio sp.]|nr:hypothetical protein [Bdellovibrio sp.]